MCFYFFIVRAIRHRFFVLFFMIVTKWLTAYYQNYFDTGNIAIVFRRSRGSGNEVVFLLTIMLELFYYWTT